MNTSRTRSWLKLALLFGVLYAVIGVVTGEFAMRASTHPAVVAWRLSAWLSSAALFLVHVFLEHARPGNSPTMTAWRASLGSAIGAFGLAVAAMVHALSTGTGNTRLLAIALVAWPVITLVPAFLVALASAALLARFQRRPATTASR